LSITDGVYGILTEIEGREQITQLGKKLPSSYPRDIESLALLLKNALEFVENNHTN
jgi:hypothetical protein